MFCFPHTCSVPPLSFLSLHANAVSHLWQGASTGSSVQAGEETRGGTMENSSRNVREKREEGRTKKGKEGKYVGYSLATLDRKQKKAESGFLNKLVSSG